MSYKVVVNHSGNGKTMVTAVIEFKVKDKKMRFGKVFEISAKNVDAEELSRIQHETIQSCIDYMKSRKKFAGVDWEAMRQGTYEDCA